MTKLWQKDGFMGLQIKLLCKITTFGGLRNINLYRHRFISQVICTKQAKSLILLTGFVLVVFAFAILEGIGPNNFALARTNNREDGWAIRQSSNFAGTVFSDLTDCALKMHIGRLGLTIITKAPKWNALVFNENSKTYVDLPYQHWQKQFVVSGKSNCRDASGKIALQVRNTGKMKYIEGFETYECLVSKKGDSGKNIAEEKLSQLWIASDIKAPPQIAQLFCSHLGIPAQHGIPLQANRYINGKRVSALETLSVKRCLIAASTFELLPGYKKVKDEVELFMGQSTSDAMEDLLDIPASNNESRLSKKK